MERKQLTIALDINWADILDEIIARNPDLNFRSRADVIRHCLRKQLPKLQEAFLRGEQDESKTD